MNIMKDAASIIVHDDLKKADDLYPDRTIRLTNEQKQTQMETSGDFIEMSDRNQEFMETIISGDDTWCCQYDLETKRLSGLRPFYDINGLTRHAFVPEGKTVNADVYDEVLKHLLQCIRLVRRELYRSITGLFIMTTPFPQTAIRVLNFLVRYRVTVLARSPYKPDLSPAELILFRALN
ncbi:hypothetical protein C0J52_23475 [Blattella germanica]|nr:hypothetical protein C0J52_23475 [Blattella germanica]